MTSHKTHLKVKFKKQINPGDVIAIGDIHARYDVFDGMLKWLKGSGARVILLGDLIDRGGEDLKVLDRVKSLMDDPESWGLESFNVLMGNHERMFIDVVQSKGTMWESNVCNIWERNGGNLDQLGAMTVHHNWIKDLPIYMTVGDTMFVHAGVRPGDNPANSLLTKGYVENMLWIREPFLSCGPEFNKWTNKITKIVHGHTIIGPVPDVTGDRIGIDTGAVFSGILTAYNATQGTYWKIKRKETLNIFS